MPRVEMWVSSQLERDALGDQHVNLGRLFESKAALARGRRGGRRLFVSLNSILVAARLLVNRILNTSDAPASSQILLVPALRKRISESKVEIGCLLLSGGANLVLIMKPSTYIYVLLKKEYICVLVIINHGSYLLGLSPTCMNFMNHNCAIY